MLARVGPVPYNKGLLVFKNHGHFVLTFNADQNQAA